MEEKKLIRCHPISIDIDYLHAEIDGMEEVLRKLKAKLKLLLLERNGAELSKPLIDEKILKNPKFGRATSKEIKKWKRSGQNPKKRNAKKIDLGLPISS